MAILAVPAAAQDDPPGPAPAEGATELGFTGEAGDLDDFSATAGAAVVAEAARTGQSGLRISVVEAPGFARWDVVDGGFTQASVELWVRVDSRAQAESVDILTVANARGERNFDFFVTVGGQQFKWDIFRDNWGQADTAEFDRWYFVEVTVSFEGATHWADVRIDGKDWGRVESPGVDTTVASVTLGANAAKTHTQDYDDVVVRLSTPDTIPTPVEELPPPDEPDAQPRTVKPAEDREVASEYWRGWFDDRLAPWVRSLF